MKKIPCLMCGRVFLRIFPANSKKFCTPLCGLRYSQRGDGMRTVRNQYARISGNWRHYLNRLCHTKKNRKGLKVETLLRRLKKQNGLCALTGVKMTCSAVPGQKFKTNASIDRINPKQGYTARNIQLVCVAVNGFRSDTSISEFIWWCKKVVNYAVYKKRSSLQTRVQEAS